MHKGFWWRNLEETDQLEDLGVDGIVIILKESSSNKMCVDWIDLA